MRDSVSEWRVWCSRLLAPVTWAVADAAARARVVALTMVFRAWQAVTPRAAISAASVAPAIAEQTADARSAPRAWRAALRLTHERAVALLAVALSVGAYCWYAAHGDTLVYADGISHMMIARRILFSRTPGLGQIGTTWPPFSHLLMLPFVWIEPLYRSGLAGALPSMLFYVLGTLYLFRSARLLFGSPAAGWVAALVFALNPNTLYMQSTPMTELVLLGCVMVGLFHLFRWVEAERPLDLVICAAAFAAGTLVRYDAWAMATAEALVIGYIAWRRHGRKAAEGALWLYGLLAYAGSAGWILFNWVLFGDPLYFLTGPYSAKYQEGSLKATGGLPTYHNLMNSAHEYLQATVDVTAWPLVVLAVIGCAVLFIRFGPAQRMLPVYAVWVLLFFNALSLFLGITAVYAPEVHLPHVSGYFNIRYGMMAIPAVSLFAASWVSLRRELAIIVLALAVFFSSFNPLSGAPVTLRDPLAGNMPASRQEAQWLDQHYHGGTVLIGGAPFTVLIFDTGLPDQDFLNENTPATFDQAIAAPQDQATWIVMGTGPMGVYDAVQARLAGRTDWQRYYTLRATINGVQFYQRIGSE